MNGEQRWRKGEQALKDYEKWLSNFGADSQNRQVLKYMIDHGSISPVEVFFDVGVYRLSGRIHNLRAVGVPIHTERVTLTSEKGATRNFARYSLIDD